MKGKIIQYSDGDKYFDTFKKYKKFVVTDFKTEDIQRYQDLTKLQMLEYMVINLETCPTTLKKHLQIFILFNASFQYMSLLKKLKYKDEYPFMEPAKRSVQENIRYCTKEGPLDEKNQVIYEYGIRPKKSEQGQRNDLLECYKYIKEGNKDYQLKYPLVYMKYGNKLDSLHCLHQKDRDYEMEVYYIYGPTCTGKSSYVFNKHKTSDIYVHDYTSDFFNGYNGQPVLLIDEFKSNCSKNKLTLRQLNCLCDRYPMSVNIKGSYTKFVSKIIYIVSNYGPYEEFYPHESDEIKDTFYRRLTDVIYLGERKLSDKKQLNSKMLKIFEQTNDKKNRTIMSIYDKLKNQSEKGIEEDIDVDSENELIID